MLTALIIDGIALLLVLLFLIAGARRGLVLALCGMIAYLVALTGAWYVADRASPWLAQRLEPRLAAVVSQRVDEELAQAPSDTEEEDLWALLRSAGLEEQVSNRLAEMAETGSAAMKQALTQVVALGIARVALYVAAFVLILLLWRIVSRLLDLAARLPGLHLINRLGGALLGAGKGLILVLFLITVLYAVGLLDGELVEQTALVRRLAHWNPFYESF